ncbi:MAG: fatty acid desaturase family protein [Alcanivoracaceae bacterium]
MSEHHDDAVQFAALRKRPDVAWPTVLLLLACHSAIFGSWYLVLTGSMNVWAGCLVNSVAMYFLFSPIHDAIHRSMSMNDRLNEFFMYLILLPIAPLSNGRLLRVMHFRHHRFANDPEKDPDHFTMTAPFKTLWIWFFWDFWYLIHYLKNKDDVPDCGNPLRDTVVVWVLAIGLGIYYPMEVLCLWFIPSRMMAWLIAAVFMYLPHWPHDVRHEDDAWQATHFRRGLDWLLTPLMGYQNYHLVHHLYPTVPFYRYRKIWLARRQFHEAQNPSYVDGLRLAPERVRSPREDNGAGERV